jgi:hypothetical protein
MTISTGHGGFLETEPNCSARFVKENVGGHVRRHWEKINVI